jgi:hypothetical protein
MDRRIVRMCATLPKVIFAQRSDVAYREEPPNTQLVPASEWKLVATHEAPFRRLSVPGALMVLVGLATIPFFGLGILLLKGLVMIEPNESQAVLLFGK